MNEDINWERYFALQRYDLGVGTLIAYRRHIARMAELAELRPRMRVLDTGCGTGQLTRALYATERSVTIVGIDHDETALKAAKEKFEPEDPVSFCRVDLNSNWLLLDESSFDRVTSAMVLYALRDPVRYLDRVRAHLKMGGLFVLANLVNRDAVFGVLKEQEEWLATEASLEEVALELTPELQVARHAAAEINQQILGRSDLFTPTLSELITLVEDARFEVIERDGDAYSGIAALVVARAI